MSPTDPSDYLQPDDFDHLRQPFDGMCWWCRERPATTGEHKFKRTDLARVMGDDGELLWGSYEGGTWSIRGHGALKRDRYGVLKFPQSLCQPCNSTHSQPFDVAYAEAAPHLSRSTAWVFPRVNLHKIYGDAWRVSALDLARYYVKHFGCRFVRSGIEVPQSFRDFLDGADDLTDTHLAVITTDTVRQLHGSGLSMSPDFAGTDTSRSRFVGVVMAAYVGTVGVRMEWREAWRSGRPDTWSSQFFHHPHAVINRFEDEEAVFEARTMGAGRVTRALQLVDRLSWSVGYGRPPEFRR